jgi:hypothetical protein
MPERERSLRSSSRASAVAVHVGREHSAGASLRRRRRAHSYVHARATRTRNLARPRIVLTIRLAKHTDGGATLTCLRPDGSATWQRQRGANAAFFPRHDLTHYAVETVLGHRRGFYGLVACGWDLTDFGAPWPRGPLPSDMDPSELLVGFLDVERASMAGAGQRWTAADLSAQAVNFHEARGFDATPPVIGDEQLAAIRARLAELLARWDALAPGDVLELQFTPAAAPASQS